MLCDALGYLGCMPNLAAPAKDVLITVEQHRGRLRIRRGDEVLKEVLTPSAAVSFLHVLLFEYSIGDRPHTPLLHAACLRRNGRRLLLVGPGGSGKTTLAVQLVGAGYEFEGDEHVFLQGDGVVARPRACRIKESSFPHLPEARIEAIATAPCYFNDDEGERIFNVDPRLFGSDWRIEQGRVDFIFVLRRNHGGFSSIRPMEPSAVIEFLFTETSWRTGDRRGAVAPVVALAADAKGYDLSLGEPAAAIRCVEAVLVG